MFASLKNKIKEETGSDPTLLVTSPNLPKVNTGDRLSQQGRSSSPDAVPSDQEDNKLPYIPSKFNDLLNISQPQIGPRDGESLHDWENELTKQLHKKDEEWNKRLELKEIEWNRALNILAKEKSMLEEEKSGLLTEKLALENSLQAAEDYKKKFVQYQDDLDQLEGLQTQELAKVKHLLLAKEQEVSDMASTLKEKSKQMESLQTEVKRLQRYESELSNVQDELEDFRHCSNQERSKLSTSLAKSQEEARHLHDRVAVLEQRHQITHETETDEKVQMLIKERTLLEQRLEEVHLHLSDIKTSWSEKISSLETQVGRLSRQAGEEGMERRRTELELSLTVERIRALQELLVEANVSVKSAEEASRRLTEERDSLLEEMENFRTLHSERMAASQKQIDEGKDKVQNLAEQLAESENEAKASQEECSQLALALQDAQSTSNSLTREVSLLREQLAQEKSRATEVSQALERERGDKDSMLLRNAQLNQDVELTRQELRSHEHESVDLQARLTTVESTIMEKDKELNSLKSENSEFLERLSELETIKVNEHAASALEHELRRNISDLEEQLAEKAKTIKVLQQHMGDLKKTLQRELKQSVDDSEGGAAILTPSSNRHIVAPSTGHNSSDETDVNFKYLKHVIMKFLTSREYEAQHLTRAVATLLRFSPEEERLLRETLDWKMSWFGTRPRLGFGQTSKTIPPS